MQPPGVNREEEEEGKGGPPPPIREVLPPRLRPRAPRWGGRKRCGCHLARASFDAVGVVHSFVTAEIGLYTLGGEREEEEEEDEAAVVVSRGRGFIWGKREATRDAPARSFIHLTTT